MEMQELENERQAIVITQQGEVINRLKAALITNYLKYKPEVTETGNPLVFMENVFALFALQTKLRILI